MISLIIALFCVSVAMTQFVNHVSDMINFFFRSLFRYPYTPPIEASFHFEELLLKNADDLNVVCMY
jgi:hypothetical protein